MYLITILKTSIKLRIVLLILFITSGLLGFSQSSNQDKNYLKYYNKIEKLYNNNKYYKLHIQTIRALNTYPKDKWFNYLYSYSLYYSREHKKIKKKYINKNILDNIFLYLQKSKPLQKTSNKFSRSLQKVLYKKSKELWENGEFNKSLPYLSFWFKYYDNSNKYYKNIFSENVQDDLFNFGKRLFLSNKKEKAKIIFDWMLSTFYKSNFKCKYIGTNGYNKDSYIFNEYKSPMYCLANTAKNISYLSQNEKQLIYLHNLVRMDPKLFNNTYVKTFYEKNPRKSNSSYAKSLVRDLNNSESQQFLYSNKNLFNAAEFHANDIGKAGTTGHTSTDGSDFGTRLNKFGAKGFMAENCSYGNDDALRIIMQLLIDNNVESLGHRINILNNIYSKIGVAIRPHKKWGANAVLDYQK